MKTAFKFLAVLFAVFCFIMACEVTQQDRKPLTSTDEMFNLRDTLPAGGVMPQALKKVAGRDWRFWRLSDTTFAIMSQDTSNNLESIIREDSLFAWLMTKLPDSLSLSGYADTLRLSGDTLYISGQNYVLLSDYLDNVNTATFVIAPTGTKADYNTDGTADQVQLQAAIDALPAEGGSILIREGQYNFSASANITGSSGSGAKKILIQGTVGTVISIANGQTGINVNTTITTGFGNNQDLVIRDIRFEGGSDDATAIYLEDVHLGTIEGNTFVGDSLTAISMKRVNNAKIQRNYFNKVKRGVYGLAGSVLGDDLEDIAIIGNDFSYCHWSAIHLESTSDVWQRDVSKISIVGNNIEESDYAGLYKFAVYLKNSKGSTIVGNTITQTKRGGAIELQDGSLNVISSNIFRENGEDQEIGDTTSTVMIRASNKNLFIGNTISNENVDYGFTWISADSNQFIGNISELDSLDTYREFTGTGNVVWSSQGGGGSSFDPSANIAFTGGNTHTGTEIFTGIDRVYINNEGSNGSYITIKSSNTGAASAGLKTYAHGGTIGSPSSTLAGQFIGLWSARGVATTTLLTGASAYLGFVADSNWGSGDTPSRAVIATTPDGSATSAIRLYIDHDGDVALGSSAPATSAKLDITGTTGGLLLPRLNSTQRDALTGSAGLMIFNTTIDSVQIYTSGGWRSM